MLKQFYPDNYYCSAYVIPYDKLYQKGYRGIIFDIDNTLVPHGAPADDKSINLIRRLSDLGFEIIFISNNKEPRVKPFADAVGKPYIFDSRKPMTGNYVRAMIKMGTKLDNTLFVGDQLFTDVWGAKRTGIRSYLVRPINKKEEIQIVLKRYLERIVLAAYKKQCIRRQKVFLHGR